MDIKEKFKKFNTDEYSIVGSMELVFNITIFIPMKNEPYSTCEEMKNHRAALPVQTIWIGKLECWPKEKPTGNDTQRKKWQLMCSKTFENDLNLYENY